MTKEIHYAYPTSDYAAQFGRSRQGCFFIVTESNGQRTEQGPYDTMGDAMAVADKLPGDTGPYCMSQPRFPIFA